MGFYLSVEEKQFLNRLDDRLERLSRRYLEEITDFIEPKLQLLAEQYLCQQGFIHYLFCGGYAEAERKRLILFPDYIEPDCQMANLVLLKVYGKLEYLQANHRDYLGAIMSLGLRREKFGDLIPIENGFYLFAEENTAEYVIANCPRVKGVPLKAKRMEIEQWQPPGQSVKELHIMVASMRLDGILAHGFGLSRAKAVEFIQSGRVKINHREMKENDYLCQMNDIISCRGKGKLKVITQNGETKKGKLKVLLWKYI